MKTMDVFTQLVMVVGRISPNGVQMLGSGFVVRSDGVLVTTHHVVGNSDSGLVVLAPHIQSINEYQDLADTSCRVISCRIKEIDPIRDLALLQLDGKYSGAVPQLDGFDGDSVGSDVGIFGFPHCVEGRRVLTFQKAEIGAKTLMNTDGIKSKHAVINVQARPGQSGSLVFSMPRQCISGVLIGAWIPGPGGISLGGINPRELHQTTHCISAEYIKEMM